MKGVETSLCRSLLHHMTERKLQRHTHPNGGRNILAFGDSSCVSPMLTSPWRSKSWSCSRIRGALLRHEHWHGLQIGQDRDKPHKDFAAVLDAGGTSKLSVESNVWFAACTINLDGFCRSDAVQGVPDACLCTQARLQYFTCTQSFCRGTAVCLYAVLGRIHAHLLIAWSSGLRAQALIGSQRLAASTESSGVVLNMILA